MPKLNPRLILLPILIATLIGSSLYVQKQRDKQRSALSGFFESQPTELSSRIQGRVASIHVHEGDVIKAGVDVVDLETLELAQQAGAKLKQFDQAKQQLNEVVNGPRIQEIEKQEAALREARANLAKLQNGPLPEEIAQARARLAKAAAIYAKVKAGSRPQEIEEAQAAERNAVAKLAQAKRGLTQQEKDEAKSRLDAAIAQEALAGREAARYTDLFKQDAVSRQQADQKQSEYKTAQAKRQELQHAYDLALSGTPPEELEQANQNLKQAQAALALVISGSRKEDIQAAYFDVTEAQKALQLLLRGYRKEDIAAAGARVDASVVALNELKSGNRIEQIRQARAAADAAKLTAASASTNLAENKIISPFDGSVERLPVAVGDLVNPGTTLVRISNPADIWLRVYVPESNLNRVVVGAFAKLKIDGIADMLKAKVESVASQGEFTPANLQTPDDRGKQVFAVRLRLDPPDARVKSGMAATVKQIGEWSP